MNIESNIKLWSTLGMRATFGLVAIEIAKKNPNLIIATADVSTSAGLDRFKNKYPEKYLDVGIAEQNLIGVSAGLSSEGFDVISTTFAPFQTLRCCEQIKVNLGYMKQKICMVGLASGLVLGNLGYTHCSIEDVGVLRSIPNIAIVTPSDPFELYKCVEEAIKYKNSVYIRLTGGSNTKIINRKNYNFKIGKSIKLLSGSQVVIFGCGNILGNCLEAANHLLKENISCSVINLHTIKPIDSETILNETKNCKLIVSVEEHNIIGGLGSAISEVISQKENKSKLIRIGINDSYSKGGSYDYLKDFYGLSVEKIIDKVKSNI